jgi:hypothetical protein
MRKKHSLTAALISSALALAGANQSEAVELLTNGSLDQSVGPLGWASNEFVTGEATPISLAEHVIGGNSDFDLGMPALGVTVQPWAGNTGPFFEQNKKVNYTLEQTVTGQLPNTLYKLSGDFFLESFFSGVVTDLDPFSPSGMIPSPTTAKMEMIFLNASMSPIGAPATLDLRTAVMPDVWATYMLETTSPANTAAVKVKVSLLDMVDNFTPQGVRLDNFSLKRGTSTIERLTNANLNQAGAPIGWELIESPPGTDNSSFIGFAHHMTPEAPTGQGLWVRAFEGGNFSLTQTQQAVAGGDYTFSAWSFWEPGYIGDNDTFPGTATETFLEMAFLDASSGVIGSPLTLDLDAAGQNNDSTWREFSLDGMAPAGTASVRISVMATGLANNGLGVEPQSAFFDDFSLDGPAPGVPGDWDDDNDVDGHDFLIIQQLLGTQTSATDIATWKMNYGTGGATPALEAVPEPAAATLMCAMALCGMRFARRRRRA